LAVPVALADKPALRTEGDVARSVCSGILETVGGTPLVRLERIEPELRAEVFAKMERFNPGGSIKDRTACSMVLGKIRSGEVDPSRSVLVESSSGNLAIGLAQICRYFGLRFICVVDPKTPQHIRGILDAYGVVVEVVEEPDPQTGEYLPGRLRRVKELLVSVPGAFWPNQYANQLNPRAHETTMREIAQALDGRVDYLLCAVSTTGTLLGCARYARQHGLGTTIVAVDAVGSVLFAPEPSTYRLIPGYGASVRPPLLEPGAADMAVHVTDLECVVGCRRLMQREAILAGGSAGATVAALTKLAVTIPDGATCVLIFPDGGERYLDTIYSDEWVTKCFGEVSHLWKQEPRATAETAAGAAPTLLPAR
jgi:cysteine synthase A